MKLFIITLIHPFTFFPKIKKTQRQRSKGYISYGQSYLIKKTKQKKQTVYDNATHSSSCSWLNPHITVLCFWEAAPRIRDYTPGMQSIVSERKDLGPPISAPIQLQRFG